VYVAKRGGRVVTCGSSTGYRHQYDNRYLWMRLKQIIGSRGFNYHESVGPLLQLRPARGDFNDASHNG
jgi:crotonyl-CoA reductase